MSPAIDSTAQSSLTVPMNVSSGSATHAVVADLGDRAARRERREPRALAAAHLAVDRVVVHVAAARPAPGLDAVRRELEHLVELLAREVVVRRGAAQHRVEVVGVPLLRAPTSATICCARMSSGGRGSAIASRCPARTAPSSAVHSTSSSRVSG